MFQELQSLAWVWLPWLYNKSVYITEQVSKMFSIVYRELNYTKEWVFLTNTTVPIPKGLFDTSNIDQYKIKWTANTNPPRFRNSTFTLEHWRHLTYLSFTVTLSDKTFIDITDWINEVKWCGLVQPTPLEIFSLWCCESGTPYCFDIDGALVEIVNDEGEEIKRGLNEFTHTNVYEDGGDDQDNR
jgi:hypothetical protein